MSDRAAGRECRRVVLCLSLILMLPILMPRGLPLLAAQTQEPATPATAAPASPAGAPAKPPADGKLEGRSSPWLLVPVVSSNPKLGTSFGGMGAYLRQFDPDSQVSLFGLTYQYHLDTLHHCRSVCPHFVSRGPPAHRRHRRVRVHQERLRGLSRHRAAAPDER